MLKKSTKWAFWENPWPYVLISLILALYMFEFLVGFWQILVSCFVKTSHHEEYLCVKVGYLSPVVLSFMTNACWSQLVQIHHKLMTVAMQDAATWKLKYAIFFHKFHGDNSFSLLSKLWLVVLKYLIEVKREKFYPVIFLKDKSLGAWSGELFQLQFWCSDRWQMLN